MADIFYFSVEDKEASENKRMFQIPLKDCVHFFDLRPWQRECGLEEFPNLLTGDPLVDASGYVFVLMRISAEEIEENKEGSYEPGWYKMNMTVIEVQSVIAEAQKRGEKKRPPRSKP
ncbi:MAG: hypothetical protein GKS04_05475 [Candidatus Mycalebacterium zealandia]|nr:MAG: hypothetical protein GKS04_05475 [Candidatus Mycalebacterium zealandia]